MDCTETLEQLADYLDEDAREELCRAIEAHLSRCHDCQFKVDTVRKTIVLYQADSSVEVPAGASARLHSVLSEAYAQAAGPAGSWAPRGPRQPFRKSDEPPGF